MATGKAQQKPAMFCLQVTQSIQEIIGEQPFFSLRVGATQVDIIGTAHVSALSRDTVAALIRQKYYDVVALELCERRHAALEGVDHLAEMDLWNVIKQNKMFSVMAMLVFSAYQRRIGAQLGVEPGAEFKEAITQCKDLDIPTILVDRDIGVSLKRFYRNMKWWHRPLLFSALIAGMFSDDSLSERELENMKKEGAFFSALDQLWPGSKELMHTLVTERDQYMAAKIQQYVTEHKPSRMLVVVGAGHLNGMRELLRQGQGDMASNKRLIDEYCEVPPRATYFKYFPWVLTVLILSGFFVGFSRDMEVGAALVGYWFLVNGVLAAVGAMLVLAHPLTVLAAFLAAPLTSLNPLIGVGMVTATVQFTLRKPHVSDFSRVKSDIISFAGWRRNRFTHLFLVFLFSSIGSIAGTYIGGIYIFSVLSG